MIKNDKKLIRCAIYTRKSTQEGLEQEFNSLDAQREAGESYIKSQRHENWNPLPKHYDDGGFSGGTLERPALRALIMDIEKGLIDVVVVYKVDRLSRSLHDFIRLVEIFDKYNVSFVSVTQQFNTTSSMGRLTLNVLLSFAQFEREVIGERVRDKIAASRQKGIWMGGTPPLGYTIKDRKLIIVPEEAGAVRVIFQEYLACSSTIDLTNTLEKKGIRSKIWTSLSTGIKRGGAVFNRSMLYVLLHNRTYIGEAAHKDKSYPGEHTAIIGKDLFDQVQAKLNKRNSRAEHNQYQLSGLLDGLLLDATNRAYLSIHSMKKGRPEGTKHHHYYVIPQEIQKQDDRPRAENIRTEKLDGPVVEFLRKVAPKKVFKGWDQERLAKKRSIIRQYVDKVIVHEEKIDLFLKTENGLKHHSIPIQLHKYDGRKLLLDPRGKDVLASLADKDISLITALVQAHKWKTAIKDNGSLREIAKLEKLDHKYVAKIYQFNFLSPKIKEAILDGIQPRNLTLSKLIKDIPIHWQDQENLYGF